jgi:uncharacterized iron-regulated membrane protein
MNVDEGLAGSLDRAARSGALPKSKLLSSRRLWWRLHQWAGLQLSLLMAFVCLTGTFATLGHEIDWLITPSLRVTPTTADLDPQWAALAAKAAVHRPDARIIEIRAPEAAAFAARVVVETPGGERLYLNSHPMTGTVQGESRWYGAHRLLSKLHERMNIESDLIKIVISGLSIILLVSTVSAMIVYRKWWRGFLRPVRIRDARAGWGDFHRLAGVWSMAFAFIIGVSGLLFFLSNVGLGATRPSPAKTPLITSNAATLSAQIPQALASAQFAFPALQITKIKFPDKKSGTFVFEGKSDAILVRDRANSIWVEPQTGRVLQHDTPATLDGWTRLHEAAQPLHFGTFGGYWMRYVWFIFGALLTALPVSGVAIYGLRLSRAAASETEGGSLVRVVWLGMGTLRWPIAGLVLAGLIATCLQF